MIVPVIGDVPVFTAVNEGMPPEPKDAVPMPGVSFVQPNIVPTTGPENVTAVDDEPLHRIWFATGSAVGEGFTVISNVCGVPEQPLAVGVTDIVAVMGVVPEFIAVKLGISPVPAAAKPMDGLLFVQL